MVINKTGETAIVSIASHVMEYCPACGPTGNFSKVQNEGETTSKHKYGSLETAKYHLYLGRPDRTPFVDDFDKSITNLEKVQEKIGSCAKHLNLIVLDSPDKHLCFTQNVSKRKDRPVSEPLSCVSSVQRMTHPAENAVYSKTENWPVPADMQDDLDTIKHVFVMVPLSIFIGNKFVDPDNAENVLNSALVEIFFELYHYAIRRDNKDSYNDMIEQIQILQPGGVRCVNTYKWKNVHDEPIHHLPLLHTDDNALNILKQDTPNVSTSSVVTSSTVDHSPLALANNARNGMSKPADSNMFI